MNIKEYTEAKKKVEEFERREKTWITISSAKNSVKSLPDIYMVYTDKYNKGRDSVEYKIPDIIKEQLRAALLLELQKMETAALDKMKEL